MWYQVSARKFFYCIFNFLGHFKGTTRGLSGVFLRLVMNPLCPLKYYDRSMVCHGQYNTFVWEELSRWLRNAAGLLDVPLSNFKQKNVFWRFWYYDTVLISLILRLCEHSKGMIICNATPSSGNDLFIENVFPILGRTFFSGMKVGCPTPPGFTGPEKCPVLCGQAMSGKF